MVAIATTDVQHDVSGPGSGSASHKRESVFEQPLRVTVLLRRSGCGALVKESSDVTGAVCAGVVTTPRNLDQAGPRSVPGDCHGVFSGIAVPKQRADLESPMVAFGNRSGVVQIIQLAPRKFPSG
jgi:hypothetical protein